MQTKRGNRHMQPNRRIYISSPPEYVGVRGVRVEMNEYDEMDSDPQWNTTAPLHMPCCLQPVTTAVCASGAQKRAMLCTDPSHCL